MSDSYTVEFRIYGKSLDFEQTSKDLGLLPTTLQTMGELAYSNKRFEKSMWGYAQVEEGKGTKEWSSLEDAIQALLEELKPLKKRIRLYQTRNSTVFWCGHFHNTFGSGPTLSSKLLKEVADLGIDIDISTYFSGGTLE